jgi:hypothetical protein
VKTVGWLNGVVNGVYDKILSVRALASSERGVLVFCLYFRCVGDGIWDGIESRGGVGVLLVF